jgi:PEP-CTERM motif
MKLTLRLLVACMAAAFALASASAQELFIYNNTLSNTGSFFPNGGAALVGANTITRLVADDLTPIGGYAGMPIDNLYFSVVNANAGAVSARPRLRMWDNTGAGGGPGAFIAGFTFNAISFTGNSASSFFFHPTGVNVPSGTFWIGLTFDNNSGATGATDVQLNNLGMALFNPPTVGTSADTLFETTAAGDFLVNNPAGSQFNFGGNPAANAFFGVTVLVPEPSSMALAGLGAAGLVMFRRRK